MTRIGGGGGCRMQFLSVALTLSRGLPSPLKKDSLQFMREREGRAIPKFLEGGFERMKTLF